jgi:hypothetical protein
MVHEAVASPPCLHLSARHRCRQGGLAVVVLDPGGEVDTLAFNRLDQRGTLRRLAPEHRRAFALLREGLDQRDWEALGEAVTLSACAHQAILPDPLLEMALAREVGALGVCRAHSGTLLGLLLDPVRADVPAVVDFVARRLPDGVNVAHYPLVDGGPRYNVNLETFNHNVGIKMKGQTSEVSKTSEVWPNTFALYPYDSVRSTRK